MRQRHDWTKIGLNNTQTQYRTKYLNIGVGGWVNTSSPAGAEGKHRVPDEYDPDDRRTLAVTIKSTLGHARPKESSF